MKDSAKDVIQESLNNPISKEENQNKSIKPNFLNLSNPKNNLI